MGRPRGDSRALRLQIATHMSPQPEGLEGGEAGRKEGTQRDWGREMTEQRKRFCQGRRCSGELDGGRSRTQQTGTPEVLSNEKEKQQEHDSSLNLAGETLIPH